MVSLRAERERATALLRRDRWRLGGVIGVVLLAIVGLLVLAGGKPVPPGRSAYDAGTTDPVAAAVPVLAGYAEQARGLRFRQPPVVRVADAATVARAAAESTAVDSGDRALTDRALGFSGRPATTAPAAAYSYRQRMVYLRQGQPVDAAARVALVHELTLALQDQNVDLATLRRRAADDPDRARALAALVEGDATRVELAYLGSLARRGPDRGSGEARRLPQSGLVRAAGGGIPDDGGPGLRGGTGRAGRQPGGGRGVPAAADLDGAGHRPEGVPGRGRAAGRAAAAGRGAAGGRRARSASSGWRR